MHSEEESGCRHGASGISRRGFLGTAGDGRWPAWQKLGYDRHSVIADPLFVDPRRGDYRLRDDAPAFKLGFQAIPLEKIGLYQSPDRASWPVADDCWREKHILHPHSEP